VIDAAEVDDRWEDDAAQVVEDELHGAELIDGERRRVPHEGAHHLTGGGHGQVVGDVALTRPRPAERHPGQADAHLAEETGQVGDGHRPR
jgi:hypothetical protein